MRNDNDRVQRTELGSWRDDLYFPHLELGFITVPKAANTTLKYAIISSGFDNKTQNILNNLSRIRDKQRIHGLLRESGYSVDLNRLFDAGVKAVLTSSRDPLWRLVSFYSDKVKGGGWHTDHQTNIHRLYELEAGMSFEAFVKKVCTIEDSEREIHFRSQSNLIPEAVRSDRRLVLIKAEDMRSRQSVELLASLGIKINNKKFNKSVPQQITITRDAQEMIFDAYYDDYINFGYTRRLVES